MSGFDNILAKINADSIAAGEQKIAAAEAKADAIREEGKEKASILFDARIKRARYDADVIEAKGRSAAALYSKRAILQEKIAIIDEVIVDVRSEICALPTSEYFSFIESFVLSHPQDIPGILTLSKKDCDRLPSGFMEKLNAALSSPLTISAQFGDFDAGCIVAYGEISYNGTVDALISEKKDQLRDMINRELFDEK